MGGRQTSTQTTQQSRDPWSPATAGLTQSATMLEDYLRSPASTQTFQGPLTAAMSGNTRTGINNLVNNRGFDDATGYYRNVLDGGFMGRDNPYLADLQGAVRSAVMPGVNSVFSNAGMTGSSAHQGVLTRAMTDGMAQPLFNLHESERQRQERAAQALPALYGQQAMAQIQGGQLQEGYDQREIDSARMRFEMDRLAPLQGVNAVLPSLATLGNMGGDQTGTTTTSQKKDPWQTVAGLGAMGLGMATGMPGLGMGMSGMFGAMAPAANPWAPTVRYG